jgi:hypothetical protein
MSLEYYRNRILALFTIENVIKNTIQEPPTKVWEQLYEDVPRWWEHYKLWETQDTVSAAYKAQRLTAKAVAKNTSMNEDLGAKEVAFGNWSEKKKYPMPERIGELENYQLRRSPIGVVDRFKPEMFVPEGKGPSLKTLWGLHDLAASLMNPEFKISEQQYRFANNIFVFMPLSEAGDQAVFQYINILAKAYRQKRGTFYELVRDYRSKMTRIKFAAEHDTGTQIVCVGRGAGDKPKFRLQPAEKTHASVFDKLPKAETDTARDVMKEVGAERLAKRLGGQTFAGTFKDVDIPEGKKNVQDVDVTPGILEARRYAALHFQSLVLGQVLKYGEVTVAYRQHGGFPKYVQWDGKNKWQVGVVNGNTWEAKTPEEYIDDRPLT